MPSRRLAAAGRLSSAEARVLGEGYVFFRGIEHYLQMMHYRQTHALPEDADALAHLALRLGFAGPNAPFDILGMSPAPLMIVVGIILLQSLIAWCRRVAAAGKTPLLDLRVVMSPSERAATEVVATQTTRASVRAAAGIQALSSFIPAMVSRRRSSGTP